METEKKNDASKAREAASHVHWHYHSQKTGINHSRKTEPYVLLKCSNGKKKKENNYDGS
jgi:hypothetical protein